MATPVIFSGVRTSPKNQAAIVIVETSFAIPAIDMGTTPARWIMLSGEKVSNNSKAQLSKDVRHLAEYHTERKETRCREEEACF